jgi:hypothetical protein
MTQHSRFILFIIAFALFGTISCKKKDNSTAMGTFYLHIHSNIAANEIADNPTLYSDWNGRHYGFSSAQFFISGVTLKNANGTSYTIPDAYILVSTDSEQYIMGTAPAGTYTSVSFKVGVDAAANATTPASHPASSPLSNAAMWFGNTTQGYIFLKVRGFADTSATQTGGNLVTFSYDVGSNINLENVTMPTRGSGNYAPYILTAGGAQYIHLVCDYAKLLSTVDFHTQDSTDTYNINPSLAQNIAGNIPKMFSYEE